MERVNKTKGTQDFYKVEEEILKEYKNIIKALVYTRYNHLSPYNYYKCNKCGYYFEEWELEGNMCPNGCIETDDEDDNTLNNIHTTYDIICDYNELLDDYKKLQKEFEELKKKYRDEVNK